MGDSEDSKWLAYLYRAHSRSELVNWTRSLRYFRYCRALGGHANDGDELVCALRSESDADTVAICAVLGLPVKELDAGDVKHPNRHGARNQWTSRLAQPGRVTIAGVSVFVYVHAQQTELSVSGASGDFFEVEERDVENALRIEALLGPLAERVVLPPRPGAHCFHLSDA